MKVFLNILWYFPFFGFIFAFMTALNGLFFCLTIVGLPLGLGLLQIAKFLLAPHTYELVSQKDLSAAKGKERNKFWVIFSTIVRILYFPFGLFLAFFYVLSAFFNFLLIIGIPNGLVCVKMIPAVFNPVGKVCVGGAIARKIRADKEQAKVDKYFGNTSAASASTGGAATSSQQVLNSVDELPKTDNPRFFDDQKIADVLGHPVMYRDDLVEACRKEKEVRDNMAAVMPEVEAMPMEKIFEIVNSSNTYSPVIERCAQVVFDKENERLAAEQAERERQEEAERKAAREAEMQRLKEQLIAALGFVKRWKYVIGAVVVVIAAVWYSLWVVSDSHRFDVIADADFSGDYETVIEYALKFDDADSKYYQPALILGLKPDMYGYELSDEAKAGTAVLQQRLEDYVSNTVFNNENFMAHQFFWRQVHSKINEPVIIGPVVIADSTWLDIARAYETSLISEESGFRNQMIYSAGYAYFMYGDYNKAAKLFRKITDAPKDHFETSSYASAYLGIINLYKLIDNPCSREDAYKMLLDAPNDGILSFYKGLAELADTDTSLKKRLYNAQASFWNASVPVESYEADFIDICRNVVNNLINASVWDHYGYWYGENNKGRYIGQTKRRGWGDEGANGWGVFHYPDPDLYLNYGKFNYLESRDIESENNICFDFSGDTLYYLIDGGRKYACSTGSINPNYFQSNNISMLGVNLTLLDMYISPLSPISNIKKYNKLLERYREEEFEGEDDCDVD